MKFMPGISLLLAIVHGSALYGSKDLGRSESLGGCSQTLAETIGPASNETPFISYEILVKDHQHFLTNRGHRSQLHHELKLFRSFASFAEHNRARIDSPPASFGDHTVTRLALRWTLKPETLLTQEQIVWIYSSDYYRSTFEKTVTFFRAAERILQWQLQLMRHWSIDGLRFHALGVEGFWKRLGWMIRDLANPLMRIAFPWPYGSFWFRDYLPHWFKRNLSPTAHYFRAAFQDPGAPLSAEDRAILERYHSWEALEERRRFLEKHKLWRRFRNTLFESANIAKLATLVSVVWVATSPVTDDALFAESSTSAADHAPEMKHHEDDAKIRNYRTSLKPFLEDPRHRLEENQIQIITDLILPHTAIRVPRMEQHGRVYSYGQTHLSAMGTWEYLNEGPIRALKQDRAQNLIAETDSSTLSEIMERTGLNSLPRSVQIITIRTTREKVDSLTRYLEQQKGKRYRNSTMINDCTTMTLRALKKVGILFDPFFDLATWPFDASPSQTHFLVSLSQFLSNEIVSTYQVTVDEASDPNLHSFRNAFINLWESHLFIELFWLNQLQRAIITIQYDNDQLHNRDPQVQSQIDEWKREAIERIKSSDDFKLNSLKIERWEKIKAEGGAPDLQALEEIIRSRKIQHRQWIEQLQDRLKSAQTQLKELEESAAELEFLEKYFTDLLDRYEKLKGTP